MNKNIALKEFKEIEKLASDLRLAADGWDEDWQTLIATLMSARTTDPKTIVVATALFKKFNSVKKLSKASYKQISDIIRPVNFYKNKTKYIMELSKILDDKYKGKVPHEFDALVELPGIGKENCQCIFS